jgi:hypothetical protein
MVDLNLPFSGSRQNHAEWAPSNKDAFEYTVGSIFLTFFFSFNHCSKSQYTPLRNIGRAFKSEKQRLSIVSTIPVLPWGMSRIIITKNVTKYPTKNASI